MLIRNWILICPTEWCELYLGNNYRLLIVLTFQGMTTSTNYILSLGGEVVNVTGPCLTEQSTIYCRFDIWKVKGIYMTENIAACISPPVMYEGLDYCVCVGVMIS